MDSIRIALIGFGKIARDQHLPAIALTPGIELVAIASLNGSHPDFPLFNSVDALLDSDIDFDAVAFCTPPQARREGLCKVLGAGKHVLVEKPPGATLRELDAPLKLANDKELTFFAAWHSRFAPGVAQARALLREETIQSVKISWREDVRVWHPGQTWIWEPGGLGVFDPGINALSIITHILPRPLFVYQSELSFPGNRDTPIAVRMKMADVAGTTIDADFDWRQIGSQSWDILIHTDGREIALTKGGACLSVNGKVLVDEKEGEYAGIYKHFLELVCEQRSDVDLSPLGLVADAFMIGRRKSVEPFFEALSS